MLRAAAVVPLRCADCANGALCHHALILCVADDRAGQCKVPTLASGVVWTQVRACVCVHGWLWCACTVCTAGLVHVQW